MSVRLRVRKDGSPYWQVRFRENGVESSVSWNDPADAERFDELVKTLGAAKAREICRIVATGRQGLTVRQWLDRHNDSLTGAEGGTVARYKAYVRNDIAPTLGDIPLSVLSRDDIQDWITRMTLKGASGKTLKNKRDYLSGVLKLAVRAGEMPTNPCVGVAIPRWDRTEMCFLTKAEFALLLEHVPEYWQPLVEFLVSSGCRWSEATALKPSAVDLAAGTVRITKAWKTGAGGYTLGVPKTKKSVRTINVPTTTLAKLDYTNEWLFTNSGRGKGRFADGVIREDCGPVRIHSFHPNVWRPAVERAQKAGLTKSPRLHDLRHTCASWLIQGGRPLPSVQAHLGHESIQTTSDVYGHLDRSSGQGNADVIGDMLS